MYYHAAPSNCSRRLFVIVVTSALPAMFACGGAPDTKTADASPVCATSADSILGGALEYFIATRTPPPHRFLIPLGTDSVIPDGSQYVLNALGRALYAWPSDPVLQKQAIDIARSKGSFVTVALFYHGKTALPDGRQQFTFSGVYTDRPNDGKRIERTSIYFNCQAPDGSRYALTADTPPPGSPPPAADKAGDG